MAVRYLVLEWYAPDQVLDGALRSLADMYGGWLFLFLLEPILLAAWGYTPGKWIMGLRVRREDGRKLTWEEAGDRLVGVFFRGTGWASLSTTLPAFGTAMRSVPRTR